MRKTSRLPRDAFLKLQSAKDKRGWLVKANPSILLAEWTGQYR
jgi:hypothetical protein